MSMRFYMSFIGLSTAFFLSTNGLTATDSSGLEGPRARQQAIRNSLWWRQISMEDPTQQLSTNFTEHGLAPSKRGIKLLNFLSNRLWHKLESESSRDPTIDELTVLLVDTKRRLEGLDKAKEEGRISEEDFIAGYRLVAGHCIARIQAGEITREAEEARREVERREKEAERIKQEQQEAAAQKGEQEKTK